jgi:hypothetical protein
MSSAASSAAIANSRSARPIHFRTADVEARQLGKRIAQWTFQKFLKPRPGNA